jgi:hypothetical protein
MTSHVVLNQQFIFCTFLLITSELDEIEKSIKRPTGLFFHALSDEAIKILVANVLTKVGFPVLARSSSQLAASDA